MGAVKEAIEGYVQLGQWWVKQWGDHAEKVAAGVDSGSYTPDQAVSDLNECVRLAGETLFLIGNEALDAAMILTGQADEPHWVQSLDHQTSAGQAAAGARTLRVDGPLKALIGSDSIPVMSVNLVPPNLGPGVTTFCLMVDATGHAGVTYQGTVRVEEPATGVLLEMITVWVSVP